MKIRFLVECEPAFNGLILCKYSVGDIIDIPEENATMFVMMGYAEKVSENRIDPNQIETPEHEEVFMRR